MEERLDKIDKNIDWPQRQDMTAVTFYVPTDYQGGMNFLINEDARLIFPNPFDSASFMQTFTEIAWMLMKNNMNVERMIILVNHDRFRLLGDHIMGSGRVQTMSWKLEYQQFTGHLYTIPVTIGCHTIQHDLILVPGLPIVFRNDEVPVDFKLIT